MHDVELLTLVEEFGRLSERMGVVRAEIAHHVRMIGLVKSAIADAAERAPESDPAALAPVVRLRRAPRHSGATRREIVQQWGQAHESFSPGELAREFDIKLSTMRSLFSILKTEGEIVSVGNGQYSLKRLDSSLERKAAS
jgi:DNA-binding GntR family transcriptional regulator